MKLKLSENLFRDGNIIISYETAVATIKGNKLIEHGKYSRTTSKHIYKVAGLYNLEVVRAKTKEPFWQLEYGVKCSVPGTLSKKSSLEVSEKIKEGMDLVNALASLESPTRNDLVIIDRELKSLGIGVKEFTALKKWHHLKTFI